MRRDNLVQFPNNQEPTNRSEDLLIREIRDLISQFQNEDLPMDTREEVFNEIIDLTDQLTELLDSC